MVEYKFNEENILREIGEYVENTYFQHYSKNKLQTTEVVVDCGHGDGFFIGNILKYAQRYKNKGSGPDEYRKDLFKIVHYGILAIYNHDLKYGVEYENK